MNGICAGTDQEGLLTHKRPKANPLCGSILAPAGIVGTPQRVRNGKRLSKLRKALRTSDSYVSVLWVNINLSRNRPSPIGSCFPNREAFKGVEFKIWGYSTPWDRRELPRSMSSHDRLDTLDVRWIQNSGGKAFLPGKSIPGCFHVDFANSAVTGGKEEMRQPLVIGKRGWGVLQIMEIPGSPASSFSPYKATIVASANSYIWSILRIINSLSELCSWLTQYLSTHRYILPRPRTNCIASWTVNGACVYENSSSGNFHW